MNRILASQLIAMTLAGFASNSYADTEKSIYGKTDLAINQTETFSVEKNEEVVNYQWVAPVGCKITNGQGSPTIELQSTYLAQNSPLKLIRTFKDQKTDTLSTDLTFHRYIKSFQDHSIKPGESIEIAGNTYTEADIYYEPAGKDEQGFEQVVAHRLTVDLEGAQYRSMTEPYLQTATDHSIYISWKTDFNNSPVVKFGKTKEDLNQQTSGTIETLSESYFWNSVHLTDLEPNTIYYYQIQSGEKTSPVYRFRTMPTKGSNTKMRILLMGDHQLKKRSGYEWLMQAAQRKIEEKYGNLEENINMIMNVGDQVDNGTLDQYEWINYYKNKQMSPYLPIMTAVGNHDTYSDPGMARYAAHNHYEELEYQGIKSGTENYYAYQAGRILFVVLSTEHTGEAQKSWVRKVVDAAKNDDSVDFIISVNHRPIQAEQYIGDISAWVRNEIIPILSETPKHILNYGGHHHLYHRGQIADYPLYHIINGAASYDQMWGMSSEKDYDDVQKTIDYWGYQILEFDFDKKEMKAECYAIGNKMLVTENILIDSFHRTFGQEAPQQPVLNEVDKEIKLPYTFKGSPYSTTTQEKLNTVQYQFSTNPNFSTISLNVVRDVEDLYGSTKDPLYLPIDLNHNVDITEYTLPSQSLSNGTYYVRVRYRDENLEWSNWSDAKTFNIIGSIISKPVITLENKVFKPGDEIEISYANAPVGKNAWIGIYRKGEKPGTGAGTTTSYKWAYTTEAAGSLKFKIDETNEYYAVLFQDGGYTEVTDRQAFYFGPTPELTLEKTKFEVGEDITVNFQNAPGLKDDWIAIYRMGKTPGGIGSENWSDAWQYTNQAQEGKITFTQDLPKGYYFVNYFTRGEYFEPRERILITIGEDISSISLDKNEFTTQEDITIHYHEAPGRPKDWIGVYEEGKVPGVDDLDGFFYTYGGIDGNITINAGDLKPGKYFSSLYIDDSWEEVSERKNFVVKGARTDDKTGVTTLYGTWNNEELQSLDLSNATVLDLRNATISEDFALNETVNPNCLVYITAETVLNNEQPNVVRISQDGAEAKQIVLKDQYPFYNSCPFTAGSVVYNRSALNSSWSSAVLPFAFNTNNLSNDIQVYTYTDIVADGESGYLKVKQAEGELAANQPLLFKSQNPEVQIEATDALIGITPSDPSTPVANSGYTVKGSYKTVESLPVGSLILSQDKFWMVDSENTGIRSFRTYISPATTGNQIKTLNIVTEGTTQIEDALHTPAVEKADIYKLDGVCIKKQANVTESLEELPAGIYIINGQKVIINKK